MLNIIELLDIPNTERNVPSQILNIYIYVHTSKNLPLEKVRKAEKEIPRGNCFSNGDKRSRIGNTNTPAVYITWLFLQT